MAVVGVVLVMLLAVVASTFLVRMSPRPIPAPLVQIALGAVIAFTTNFRVPLNPELFFLLFLPPLLFIDGWRIPKHGLFRDGWTILELALGLVVFTTIGLGFFIHWMIPAMSIPVAFALAAVLSPTDPIAVSAITSRTPMPKRLMHILEGESLLNDATGLVFLRFAVVAALTGTFSIGDATLTFLQLSVGGLAIGVAVTWGITSAKNLLSQKFGEESGSQILVSLMIPFAAYLLAEQFHCSGILAAVAAGITMSYVELSGQALASTRVRRSAVWDAVQFALNGVIFVLLGEQLPGIVAGASETLAAGGGQQPWQIALYAFAIMLVLIVLRFTWVWASLRFTIFRERRNGEVVPKPSFRLVAAISLAGVRGAITLAGVMTLPLVLANGAPFPARDLAILLAASVIVLSLLLATFFLPMALKGIEFGLDPRRELAEDRARVAAAEVAMRAIEHAQHTMAVAQADPDTYADAAARIMDLYRHRIDGRSTAEAADEVRRIDDIERRLRLAGLRAERDEIYRIARARNLDDDIARKLVREIDLLEARYVG